MSSGPADANAEGELVENVWCAAYDLSVAIDKAKAGHRGIGMSDDAILRQVNDGLGRSGFRLIKR